MIVIRMHEVRAAYTREESQRELTAAYYGPFETRGEADRRLGLAGFFKSSMYPNKWMRGGDAWVAEVCEVESPNECVWLRSFGSKMRHQSETDPLEQVPDRLHHLGH